MHFALKYFLHITVVWRPFMPSYKNSAIYKISKILSARQKRGMIYLILLIILSGLLEMFSISILIPLFSLVMDPDQFILTLQAAIERFPMLGSLIDLNDSQSIKHFAILFLLFIILIFVLKVLMLVYIVYRQTRFTKYAQIDIESRLLSEIMSMPYEKYIHADIPSLMHLLNDDLPNTFSLLMALLSVVSEAVVMLFLCIFLFRMNPTIMLILIVVMSLVTLLNSKVLKKRLTFLGEQALQVETNVLRWRTEALHGFKDIHILDRQSFFSDSHYREGKKHADILVKYSIFNVLPRHLIETSGMITLLFMIILFFIRGESGTDVITQVTVMGVAALRILPCVNRINTHFAEIAYRKAKLNAVYDYFQQSQQAGEMSPVQHNDETMPHTFQDCIQVDHITYTYPDTEKKIFEDACLTIRKGQSVGIKGASGAGKTTLVDILLGLLNPQEGRILCDGRNIFDNHSSWLANIGYIPQSIYLINRSIRDNVAFAIKPSEIDDNRVWDVLSEAQLDDFVKKLPDGLNTVVGERGIRMSGGQQQRIGIARALYHDPEIIVMDEATSALDNDTEAAFMKAVNTFQGNKTLIIIAHRLQTIQNCDDIYEVVDGHLIRQ